MLWRSNCLLHASLLGMWGLHDSGKVDGLSTLRAALSRKLAAPDYEPHMRARFMEENGPCTPARSRIRPRPRH